MDLNNVFLIRLCVSYIYDFLESECSRSGDSYWKDFKGRGFTCDLSYGYEFLEAFSDYLRQVWEDLLNEKLSRSGEAPV